MHDPHHVTNTEQVTVAADAPVSSPAPAGDSPSFEEDLAATRASGKARIGWSTRIKLAVVLSFLVMIAVPLANRVQTGSKKPGDGDGNSEHQAAPANHSSPPLAIGANSTPPAAANQTEPGELLASQQGKAAPLEYESTATPTRDVVSLTGAGRPSADDDASFATGMRRDAPPSALFEPSDTVPVPSRAGIGAPAAQPSKPNTATPQPFATATREPEPPTPAPVSRATYPPRNDITPPRETPASVPLEPVPNSAPGPLQATPRGVPRGLVGGKIEPIKHVVRRGENFWTISRHYYGSGRYYRALWKANAEQVPKIDELYVGTPILVPPPEDLDRSLIDPPASSKGAAGPPSAARRPSALDAEVQRASADDGTLFKVADPKLPASEEIAGETPHPRTRVHIVKPYETLRSIAARELGDSRRDEELLKLNAELVDDPFDLPVGTRLRIPVEPEP